jgi:hypothetical protein
MQVLDDTVYVLIQGLDIGILETIVSPWNPNRMILVLTGVGANGPSYAANALLSRNFGGLDLAGNVVFAGPNTVSPIDTRSVFEVTEILQEAVLSATEPTSLPTETQRPVHTVTPGPTVTPAPTNTPGSATPLPSTAIFTFTPLPTVSTALPTYPPFSTEENPLIPPEPEPPEWLNYLVIGTGGVVGLVVLGGILRALTSRRRKK